MLSWNDEPEFDEIVSDFTKLIDKLKALSTRKDQEGQNEMEAANAAATRGRAAYAEKDKANVVAAKLQAIFETGE